MKNLFRNSNFKNALLGLIVLAFVVLLFFANINGLQNNNAPKQAITYYMENYETTASESEISAQYVNFGCHSEIHIYENEILVLRLNYRFGRFSEVG